MTEREHSAASPETAEAWQSVAAEIEEARRRLGDPTEFLAPAGSPLAAEDERSAPYHLTGVWRTLMAAGIDNLDAVRAQVIDHQELRAMAPFSLCRAALESFAAAYWMISPTSPNERLARTLRWSFQDLRDLDAVDQIGKNPRDFDDRARRLRAIAQSLGLDSGAVEKHLFSTAIIKAVDAAAGRTSHDFERVWRVCSGFAHGRRWASTNLLDRQKVRIDAGGADGYRMTSSFESILWPTKEAANLMKSSMSRYTVLCSSLT